MIQHEPEANELTEQILKVNSLPELEKLLAPFGKVWGQYKPIKLSSGACIRHIHNLINNETDRDTLLSFNGYTRALQQIGLPFVVTDSIRKRILNTHILVRLAQDAPNLK